jgi:hypothetical protein
MNNILFVPLDLPPIPKELTIEGIKNLYHYIPNSNSKEQLRDEKRYWMSEWKVLKLRVNTDIGTKQAHFRGQYSTGEYEWTSEARILMPNTIKWIEEYLPFKNLKYIAALVSDGSVISHTDISHWTPAELVQEIAKTDPSMYRILLDGSIDSNSFFIENDRVGKKYVTLPTDSPGWAMSGTACYHGNDQTESNKKLLLYVMGDLDLDRHVRLIEKSVNRFKEYIIYDN